MTNTRLPLSGIRVAEFTHMVMGPSCGLILADLGAEVIHIEGVEGDATRTLRGSGAGYWPTYNRNKKSLAVNLKDPRGLSAVSALIATCDVVTENFRPGTMDKLGLGYEHAKALKPDILYCSMKGFLPGPYEHRVALDEVVQMMGGLAYMTGPVGKPLRAGASVNDVMGGMFAAIAILAALRERDQTGQGQYLQSGLFENNVFLVGQHMAQFAVTGKPASPMPNRISAWAVYDVFDVASEERVFVAAVSDAQWKVFCDVFGFPDLLADASLATNNQRVGAREKFMPVLRERMLTLAKDEVMSRCEKAGLPYAPIAKPHELFDDPHLRESDGLAPVTLDDGTKTEVPKLPIVMDDRRFGTRLDLPSIGAHSREVLAAAGVNADVVEQMLRDGVIR